MGEDVTLHKLAVLYADVSGSTRLYERVGDSVARADIAACLALLAEVAGRHDGRLLKTIGDEVECVFPIPQRAVAAAIEMHECLREASDAARFRSGALKVKIGCHYGVAEWRGRNLVGATPAIAQQVIGLAQAEEILLSGDVLEGLPGALAVDCQLLDTLESCADGAALPVHKLSWEESDEVTQFHAAPQTAPPGHTCLVLEHGGRELRVDADNRHCRIGRIAGNDIVTGSRFTSRRHAEIEYRHGRFVLRDASINGTLIAPDGGETVHLRREEGLLEGRGVLIFGNTTTRDAAATARYRCE